jgi:hypothetical protein
VVSDALRYDECCYLRLYHNKQRHNDGNLQEEIHITSLVFDMESEISLRTPFGVKVECYRKRFVFIDAFIFK